jgi:hypothetical protein
MKSEIFGTAYRKWFRPEAKRTVFSRHRSLMIVCAQSRTQGVGSSGDIPDTVTEATNAVLPKALVAIVAPSSKCPQGFFEPEASLRGPA